MPKLFPPTLLIDTLRRNRLLLCLDYDGTISETARNPDEAVPIEGVRDAIAILSRHPEDVLVGIASGRDAAVTRRIVGLYRGVFYIGLHGIELLDPAENRHILTPVKHCVAALQKVREFLSTPARPNEGFVVEDKGISLALHFRLAHPNRAREICRRLEHFVRTQTRGLRVAYGDMVAEIIPSNTAGKGFAITQILESVGDPLLKPVYFGNNPTDEEAFYAVRREDGITVLVGEERETRAEYRLDSPAEVVQVLCGLAQVLERGK